MSLADAFDLTALVAEAALAGLLTYRRVDRTLPVFFVYCWWALASDLLANSLRHLTRSGYGINFYLASSIVDIAIQLCVLVELAWSVLRPLRPNLSKKALGFIAVAMLGAGAAIWPLSYPSPIALPSHVWRLVVQLQQTSSILRVFFFLLLAMCSQWLSLSFRDRELQVATGFGFYSVVSLAVAALTARQSHTVQFVHLYWVVAISFLCSLLYWVFSFAQRDAPRQEFTPQMENFLLDIARKARLSRAAEARLAVAAARPRSRNSI